MEKTQEFYYKNLNVYHLAKQMVVDVYNYTKDFPQQELYALTNQLQRAAISVPSNIAEGMRRFSVKERVHFLEIAYGSLMEVMCQLEIAEALGYLPKEQLQEQEMRMSNISKMLFGLKKTIEEKNINV